ncbi:MAG: sigma 54-interacting transcriptional regulator, partial [Rhodospirillaceae bacterium]|nr:sigma 54-interacting transcriptional regulator [Rhodospirillaceae bacterium]
MLAPVGKSNTMRALRDQVARIAHHDAHTLLTGEPGSGRQAFARYLASLSARSAAPFVIVMGGGTDTGDGTAVFLGDGRTPGALERAAGGVLFINELGDMPASTQQMLLGILEQGRYRPAGSTADRDLDARILSSAPPGFEQRLEGFRRELLSHLSVVVIRIPPLREYAEDVPELLRYYVDLLVDSQDLPFRRFGVAA